MAASTLPANAVELEHDPSPSPPYACPLALTASQIAIVKATAPVLKEHGTTITALFYRNLLTAHPALNNMFNTAAQRTGAQPRALAASVLAYATHIDDLPALRHAVERIAHKHASLGVEPEQYALVGEHLMGAIGAVLGDAATPEIVDAWTAAYAVLASVFIGRERELYDAHKNWLGWRKFRITRRQREAEGIESFYLAPVDGAPLPSYLPGQYVSLKLFVSSLGYAQSRQFSLSEAPREEGDYYRITVKREEGPTIEVPGLISLMLQDECEVGSVVELTHPQGEFFVDPRDRSKEGVPLVLISAGVGATPIMSILDSVTQEKPGVAQRPISWLHASRSRKAQPFADVVQNIAKANAARMSSRVFLRTLTPEDDAGAHYDFGDIRMDLGKLDKARDLFIPNQAAEYYICGPEPFMRDVRADLEAMGVSRDRINLELFATGDVE